jgi:UMF1 family MFS transporter
MREMENGIRQRRPRYSDEDTTPTTERELQAWYSYAIAAEVFAVSGTGSFLPVTLEQLARERGVLKSDGVTSCVEPVKQAAKFLLQRAEEAVRDDICVVDIFGAKIATSSFALYTSSLAVGVQALVLISISAIADHGGLS